LYEVKSSYVFVSTIKYNKYAYSGKAGGFFYDCYFHYAEKNLKNLLTEDVFSDFWADIQENFSLLLAYSRP
jgi:hypothetical protein